MTISMGTNEMETGAMADLESHNVATCAGKYILRLALQASWDWIVNSHFLVLVN